MVSAVFTSDLNLDLCAQEPIRHSVLEPAGSIQPHGMLVVADPDSRQIVQASANSAALFGNDRRATVLGLSLRELIGNGPERQIATWLQNPGSNYLRTLEINGQRLQVLGHQTAQGVILEFERPPATEGETLEAYYPRIGRATNLTQHLLAFSRKQPLNPRPVAVNRLVLGMSQMLQRTLGELIEIETSLAPALRHVEIDSNQLEIALLNLAVNARDAMPDGGKLCIQTSNADLRSDGHVVTENLPRGEYVVIDVHDTGSGMSPDVLARAFEPFFTTKSVGHGTGLGLSQVYGFVRQSGGQVRISSTDGEGTTVRIFLPAARPDADVRAFTIETVRELGYDVLEARDGHSALNVLRQTPADKIDLLFSDVVLPGGMNGRLDPGVQLITKPFAFEDLATRLRSVLDGQDSTRHVN